MIRAFMIAAASAAVLTLSSAAFAQQPAQFGTADQAKAMLVKAVAAVKADKTKALVGKVDTLTATSTSFALTTRTARSLRSATLMQSNCLARTLGT